MNERTTDMAPTLTASVNLKEKINKRKFKLSCVARTVFQLQLVLLSSSLSLKDGVVKGSDGFFSISQKYTIVLFSIVLSLHCFCACHEQSLFKKTQNSANNCCAAAHQCCAPTSVGNGFGRAIATRKCRTVLCNSCKRWCGAPNITETTHCFTFGFAKKLRHFTQ